jgi:hypothetical protein
MFRTILLAAALAVATAASAQAGGFQIKIGGGSHHKQGFGGHKQNNYGKCHVDTYGVHKIEQHYHKPLVHATCYYKVCYTKPCWDYTKHKIFDCLSEAKHFAHELEHYGLNVKISKVYSPY